MTEKPVQNVSALAGYELWAPTYDATPNPVVAMDARHSVRVLTPVPGERILDAGCGTGRNLQLLEAAGAQGVGIDFSPAMLAKARRRCPESELLAVDLGSSLPFADNSFDAALCCLVGEHLSDPVATLIELCRVIRPGGRLILSVYHPELAAAGIEANFDYDGIEYRLGASYHSVEDYLGFIVDAGFDELAFATFKGDAALAEQIPGAERYAGQPLLFLIATTVAAET